MAIKRDGQGDSCVISGSFGNEPLQVTRWSGQRSSLTTSPTSARLVIPANATVIELTCTQDCFMAFGDVTVDAVAVVANDASRFFLAGLHVFPTPIDPATDIPYTHVAFINDKIPAFVQIEQVV